MPPPDPSIRVLLVALVVATIAVPVASARRHSPVETTTDGPNPATVGQLDDTAAGPEMARVETRDLAAIPVDIRPQAVGRPAIFGPAADAQVDIVNASAWHSAGIDGSGVRVGVIDFFDTKFWDTAEHGPVPVAGVDALCLDDGDDCTDVFFDGIDDGGEDHGVAVVEAIRDMAPGVEIYIGQATTIADYSALVDWFVSNEVVVVNRSLGSRYDGPGDGRGALDDVVGDAVSRGILWVNSGGNNGADRYYRQPVRLVGDRVAFGPTGSDTFLQFTGCIALGGIRWANDWDKPAWLRTDYDAFLWESPTGDPTAGQIVDSSTLRQRLGATPIEHMTEDRCPRFGSSLYLELEWRGGDTTGDVIEVLDYGAGIASFTQAEYSASVSVVDAKPAGVVAVGAIEPAASGTIADFSSNGPTNDARIAPAVSAPSGYASVAHRWFAGTSAAAAVVSGAAALLLDADLAAGPNSLGHLIRHLTIDRGEAGPDNVYGHGEFRLPDPPDPSGIDDSPSRFTAMDVPTRVLDTRPRTAVGPTELIGELRRGEILDLPIVGVAGVPADDVTAVAVNLVTVGPDRPSFVQALPTLHAQLGGFSNLNADGPGQNRANFAVIPIGADGSISIYSIADGHVVVDLLGWFESAGGAVSAGRFVELPQPERLLDSRTDAPVGPLTPNATRAVPLPSSIDPAAADALVVTVTAAFATAPGWVQAYPTDRPDAVAATSTVNVPTGGTVANTAIVPIGSQGISLTGFFADAGHSHVVVDAIGYFTSASAPTDSAGLFRPVQPARAFDSRTSSGALDDEEVVAIDASDAAGVTVPDTAAGVVWNMAIVGSTRPGYARAWAADRSEPATSALNWSRGGEIRAAAVITAVDGGAARVRFEDGTADRPGPIGHLIADVFGYFM
jgi:hypothetical protein